MVALKHTTMTTKTQHSRPLLPPPAPIPHPATLDPEKQFKGEKMARGQWIVKYQGTTKLVHSYMAFPEWIAVGHSVKQYLKTQISFWQEYRKVKNIKRWGVWSARNEVQTLEPRDTSKCWPQHQKLNSHQSPTRWPHNAPSSQNSS